MAFKKTNFWSYVFDHNNNRKCLTCDKRIVCKPTLDCAEPNHARSYKTANEKRVAAYKRRRHAGYKPPRRPWGERNRLWARRGHKRRRQELLARFGNKCAYCGFNDIRALQFDHINNDGKKCREQGKLAVTTWLSRMGKLSDEELFSKLQLLCANCHAIKTYEDFYYLGGTDLQ